MTIAEENGFTVSGLIIIFFLILWVLYPNADESIYLYAQSKYLVSFSIPLLYITYVNIFVYPYGLMDMAEELKEELNSPAKDWLADVCVTLVIGGMSIPIFLMGVAFLIVGVARIFGISNYSLLGINWGMWALIAQVAVIFAVRRLRS